MNRRWKVPVVAVGLAMLVAGCGGTSSGGASGSGSAGSSSSSSSSASASANDLLAKIQQSGQLHFAISSFAPEDFQTNKKWTGFDVDILNGFAKSLGVKLVLDSMSFASSIQAVASKSDALTIDIYYSKKRAKVISFSRPMLNYADVVAVNSQHPTITSDTVKALSGKTIAGVIGSAEIAEIKQVPNVNMKQYNKVGEAFLAVSQGRVDATFEPDADVAWARHKNASLHIKSIGPVPKSISPPLSSLQGRYGVPKGQYSKRFLAKLNAYLKKIECNGQEKKILANYGFTSSVFTKGLCSASNGPPAS